MNKIFLVLFALFFSLNCQAEIIQDDFVNETLINTKKPFVNNSYNYESLEKVPIKLEIIDEVDSEKDLFESQIVKFRVKRTIVYKNEMLIKRGTLVEAKVKMIITSGMNGIPASIILGDFKANGLDENKLTPTVEVFGQDRSLWVFPLKWVLTPLPPTGSLTNFIMGGHAKINHDKTIIIYYYPEN